MSFVRVVFSSPVGMPLTIGVADPMTVPGTMKIELDDSAMYAPALEAYVRDRIAKGVPIRFDDYMAHMKVDHSPVEDAGRIAQEAGVKTLVLSHLTPGVDGIQDETWRDLAAKHFKGEIVVARDLMVL